MNVRETAGKETGAGHFQPWIWVLLCCAAILATVPLARRAQQFIYSAAGPEFFTYTVLFISACLFLGAIYLFLVRLRIRRLSQYLWLLGAAGLFVYFTLSLREHPEEAVHLLEYGLLSYLLFNALRRNITDWTVHITAALLVLLFGIADEFMQWMVPGRYWGLKDVWINGVAGVIVQVAIGKGVKPASASGPVRARSVTIMTVAATLNIILLGLCLSNTPRSVNWYTSVVKPLSWLRSEDVMTEYGYSHSDPAIGSFTSRFATDDLMKLDSETGRVSAADLEEIDIGNEETHEKLKEKFTPFSNPFLHEYISHLLKRENALKNCNDSLEGPVNIQACNAAHRENLILEKYFYRTLQSTGVVWSAGERAAVASRAASWEGTFISNTGNLITAASMQLIQLLFLLLLVIIFLFRSIWIRKIAESETDLERSFLSEKP